MKNNLLSALVPTLFFIMLAGVFAQPANDDCANAIAIGNVENLEFTTRNATFDGPAVHNIMRNNVWYLYTAPATGTVLVSTCNPEPGDYDFGSRLTVYDGATCNDYTAPLNPVELNGGETIALATPITDPLPVYYYGTTAGYDRDFIAPLLCVHDYNSVEGESLPPDPDVFYSYTATFDGTINIDVYSADIDPVVAILDDSGNLLECDRSSGLPDWVAQILNFPVAVGETYYIVVTGYYDFEGGPFILEISSPEYTILGYNDRYWSESRVEFEAIEGNQYLIEIGDVSDDLPVDIGYLHVVPPPTPPSNDDCANAEIIGDGILHPDVPIQFTGDNTGATIDGYTVPINLDWAAVWIKFTTEETLSVVIDRCETDENFLRTASYLFASCEFDELIPWTGYDHFSWCSENFNNTTVIWENLPPGTYLYPIATACRSQGPYVLTVTGLLPQWCREGSVFSQEPFQEFWDDSSERPNFQVSESREGLAIADHFQGAGGSINKIVWWGISADPDDPLISCDDENPIPFRIVFCETNDLEPYIPGDTVAVYNQSITPELTGCNFDHVPQKKFTAILDSTVNLLDGWLIIQSTGTNDCAFHWQSSAVGEEEGLLYDFMSHQWELLNDDLAFCLYEDVTYIDETFNVPSAIALSQNYPNPFNATTTINFSLKSAGEVTLSVYDIGGRLVKSLYNGALTAGSHSFIWDGSDNSGSDVSSGVYFYRLQSLEGIHSRSMVLLK